MIPAAVLATGLAALSALALGLVLLRLRGHFLALGTLGLGIIVTVLARESDFTGRTTGIYGVPKPTLNGRKSRDSWCPCLMRIAHRAGVSVRAMKPEITTAKVSVTANWR